MAKVTSGESVLVHGTAGRVRTAALELGAIVGLRLYGTCSARDRTTVERLGAVTIDHRNEDFVARVRELTGAGVDVALDGLGGAVSLRSFRALRGPAMQVVVDRPVDPGQPDQPEHDGEPAHTGPRHLAREVVGRLGDDDDVHQVFRTVEEADLASLDDIAEGRTRTYVFLQMGILALLAVFTGGATAGDGPAFAVVYSAFLFLLGWLWYSVRLRDDPVFRPSTTPYIAGVLVSAIVVGASALLPEGARLAAWSPGRSWSPGGSPASSCWTGGVGPVGTPAATRASR